MSDMNNTDTGVTLTMSNANGAVVSDVYPSKESAAAFVRSIGGKRIRRAKATPSSLTYYQLPNGAQVCIKE